MSGPIRVLVVDDSALARGLIGALIAASPGLVLCGEAEHGREAVAQVLALKPDIVTMDMNMPVMNGMDAIAEIMAVRATPILVLSDLADASMAVAAVARGALEVARKPSLDEGPALTARLEMLARVPVIRHIRRPSQPDGPDALATPDIFHRPIQPPCSIPYRVVAIAASTGGPQALGRLLPLLPADFPAPVLIAQHIADGFAAGMATWLDTISPLPVTLARDGEPLSAGHVYLADSTTHLLVGATGRLTLVPRRDEHIYRPSCDALLTSVARYAGARAVGVILTGMGRDGVTGLMAIHQAGGMTIAQDEESSVIFGMNQEAIRAGGVRWVLPLAHIAANLCRLTGAPNPRHGPMIES